MGSAGTFESYKREAVHLERQLEEKVSRYQQVAQRWTALVHSGTNPVSATDNTNNLSLAEQGSNAVVSIPPPDSTVFEHDITVLLGHLQDLIQYKLASAAITPSQRAMCQRYRDIAADWKRDYEKASLVVRRARERYELLATASGGGGGAGSGDDNGTESLLRERNHINNSLNLTASVIGQAEKVHQDLRGQGRSLRSVGNMMIQLTSNIPGLNTLVDGIRRRRSQDDKVVAGVIASCIVFTLWYIFG